ncbi:hypothetical protein D9757_004647 [Collybiopsis confluens]|uniref:DUF1754-domain-containing protein n=1 Tax=Collybiopsis confluens TaxID=2823264 RepID=A0A8H5MBQ0_9AGAR|nr:hypothetical protein D9757_004647 [Collybiopsis confluens]
MSDAYDVRPGSKLKLKGTVADGGVVKKRKKKSKTSSSASEKARERERVKELLLQDSDVHSPSPGGSGRNSPAAGSSKTEAERRFEEVQKERLAQRVAKLAHKTHKDRVSEFNTHLESLSEHHDIPKVGPG